MKRLMMVGVVMLAVTQVACFTRVSETDHCVELMYGKTVNEKMKTGLNGTVLTNAECFSTVEQNHVLEGVTVSTSNPIALTIPRVTVVWEYPDDVYNLVFKDKRENEAAVAEVNNGIESGIVQAMRRFSLDDVFSSKFEQIPIAMQQDAQKAVGKRAVIKRVILTGKFSGIEAIEEERKQTLLNAQQQKTARESAVTDSINNLRTLAREQTLAKVKELTAAAYSENPKLMELEVARAMSSWTPCAKQDRSGAVSVASTCIVGASALEGLFTGKR